MEIQDSFRSANSCPPGPLAPRAQSSPCADPRKRHTPRRQVQRGHLQQSPDRRNQSEPGSAGQLSAQPVRASFREVSFRQETGPPANSRPPGQAHPAAVSSLDRSPKTRHRSIDTAHDFVPENPATRTTSATTASREPESPETLACTKPANPQADRSPADTNVPKADPMASEKNN